MATGRNHGKHELNDGDIKNNVQRRIIHHQFLGQYIGQRKANRTKNNDEHGRVRIAKARPENSQHPDNTQHQSKHAKAVYFFAQQHAGNNHGPDRP